MLTNVKYCFLKHVSTERECVCVCVLGYKIKCIPHYGASSKFENHCWQAKQGITIAMLKSMGKNKRLSVETLYFPQTIVKDREEKSMANNS